jgi:hypothetical protein
MFTATDIQARLKETPFVPFRVVSTSGQSYDVTHPELMMVGKRWVFIGTASNENPSIFETASRVGMLHIADIQDFPNPPLAGSNRQQS